MRKALGFNGTFFPFPFIAVSIHWNHIVAYVGTMRNTQEFLYDSFFYGGNAAEVWARSLFAKRSFCFVWLNIQYYSCQVDFIGPLNVYDTNTHASSQRSWKSEKVKCMGYASSVYWPFTLFRNAINNVELWVLFYFFGGFVWVRIDVSEDCLMFIHWGEFCCYYFSYCSCYRSQAFQMYSAGWCMQSTK